MSIGCIAASGAPEPVRHIATAANKGKSYILAGLTSVPLQIYAIAIVAIAIRVLLALATRYTSEDYMITLRYAENLAHGHGMVYNVGERVLGTTTPLYTLFLALVSWLNLSPTLCGKAVNIAADGVLCILLYLWLRSEGLDAAGRVAAFLAAIHPLHVQWAISGMETSLVAVAGVWAWYAFARRSHLETYVALGILFLLRWDSLLITAVISGALLVRDRRLPLRPICVFVAIVAPWLLSASLYYGSPIPVTAQAKSKVYGWFADHLPTDRLRGGATGDGQGLTALIALEPTWALRRLPLQQKVLNFFIGTPLQFLLTIAACVGAVRIVRLRRVTIMTATGWAVLYGAAFLISRVLLFNWYLVPPFPIFEMLAAVGAAPALLRLTAAIPRRIQRVASVAATITAGLTTAVVMGKVLEASQNIEEHARIPIGRWLNANAHPTDTILLEPVGYIGYYSNRRVVDVIGLVSPDVLKFYDESGKWPWLAQIEHYRPEWCVLRPLEAQDVERAAVREGYPWRTSYKLAYEVSYTRGNEAQRLDFLIYGRSDVLARSQARK